MRRTLLLIPLVLFAAAVNASEQALVRIAVAANFKQTIDHLIAAHADKGTRFTVSTGATGMLYAQVVQGAPFDLFFSADRARPERLEREQQAVAGSRFTYAVGQLVLWAPRVTDRSSVLSVLQKSKVVAIADPKTAPYGAAAEQVLQKLGFWEGASFRLVRGESIGQTFQFVATGHADAGFIARSQIEEAQGNRDQLRKEVIAVDEAMHTPLEQQVVLLKSAAENKAAVRFLAFVRSPPGKEIIRAAGYAVP